MNDTNIHVVGNVDVSRPPAKLPGVDGQHTHVEPALPCTLEQADSLDTGSWRQRVFTDNISAVLTISSS